MSFCRISRATVIHVADHAQLLSAWDTYNDPLHLGLIAGFQVTEPLSKQQVRRLEPELRRLLLLTEEVASTPETDSTAGLATERSYQCGNPACQPDGKDTWTDSVAWHFCPVCGGPLQVTNERCGLSGIAVTLATTAAGAGFGAGVAA